MKERWTSAQDDFLASLPVVPRCQIQRVEVKGPPSDLEVLLLALKAHQWLGKKHQTKAAAAAACQPLASYCCIRAMCTLVFASTVTVGRVLL